MHDVFIELSLVIAITVAISAAMKSLRQPLILGYILAGLLVGPAMLNLIQSTETFNSFSNIGIALLLFIIGLGMNIHELKKLGKAVVITALASLLSVGLIGYLISHSSGFNNIEAIIIGLSLFFSSTIIIVKVLSDQKEQNRVYGKIAIGVIVLDDVVATIALLFVAASKHGGITALDIGLLVGKGLLLGLILVLVSTKLLRKVTKIMASSQELLFLFAIAWGFGVASIFEVSGFSIEVGALFAGIALASLPYAKEIASRLKPLRDFFVVLFFIYLGQSLDISNLKVGLMLGLVLSLVVIFIKPVATIFSLSLLGYTKRVSFLTGIHLSQISEFSIILAVLAANAGLVRPEVSAIITIVAIITIAVSTYLMKYDSLLFYKLEKILSLLPENSADTKISDKTKQAYQVVMFGYRKGGHEFVQTFKKSNKKFLVVDYDPLVIDLLNHYDIPNIYGDATDLELLEEINIETVKLVISLSGDFELNKTLLSQIVKRNQKAVLIARADTIEQANSLYTAGASYVMMPHFIGSEKLSQFIAKHGLKKSEFALYKKQHQSKLQARYAIEQTLKLSK